MRNSSQDMSSTMISPPRLYIVEDDGLILKDIQNTVTNLGYSVSGYSPTAEMALKSIEDNQTDLVLLDINLAGKMTGTQLGAELQSRLKIPHLYLSAYHDKRTLEEIKQTEPLGFVLKPFDENDIRVALELACFKLNQLTKQMDYPDEIFVKSKHELIPLNFSQVSYIQSSDNYCALHCEGKKYLVKQTISSLEKSLACKGFVRVHRSYLINQKHIQSIQEGHVFVEEHQIPISLSYRSNFFQKIKVL